MIDIHCHILFGIDDGSESIEDSLIMAEMAVESGVKMLAATPHSNQEDFFENYESESLRKIYLELVSGLQREKIPLQIVRGMEIFSSRDMIEKIKKGQLISLNGSRYYLIEFAFDSSPWVIQNAIEDVLGMGKIPIIAHPERYYCVQDNPNYLYEWRMLGALAQMNKSSVLGKFGTHTARTAETMLRCNMVTCIASDAHRPYIRTTDMREIEGFLEDYFPIGYRDLIMEYNPGCILQNKLLPKMPPPRPVERKKRWLWY